MQVNKTKYTFLIGRLSATLIIPIEIARKHGLTKATNVLVEETENGLLNKSNKV
jgi:hypothetical protein